MNMELRWLASHSASCFHATEALINGRAITDGQVADAIAGPAKQLNKEIVGAGLPAVAFWDHLIAQSSLIEHNRQLADVVLAKLLGRGHGHESLVGRFVGIFTDLENTFLQVLPDLIEDLELRAGPLRAAWEARGPGLLTAVARMTDEMLVANNANVVLVHPVLGGAGAANLLYNSVRVEAVLANPNAKLPEVVRLGWLLSQLNMELPVFAERVPADRLSRLGALAMLVPVLKAAEHVELARCDVKTIRLADELWQLDAFDVETADVVLNWWRTYEASRPPWSVALSALDQMLG